MMIFVISVRTLMWLEHTFLQCPVNLKFYHEILSWFNVPHNTLRNLSPEQILMQKYIPGPINDTSNADKNYLSCLLKCMYIKL